MIVQWTSSEDQAHERPPTNPAARHHELEAARDPMRSEWRDVVDRIQVLVLRNPRAAALLLTLIHTFLDEHGV
jgi:hypothetical protein